MADATSCVKILLIALSTNRIKLLRVNFSETFKGLFNHSMYCMTYIFR